MYADEDIQFPFQQLHRIDSINMYVLLVLLLFASGPSVMNVIAILINNIIYLYTYYHFRCYVAWLAGWLAGR